MEIKFKKFILILGDFITLYLGLTVTLIVRYGSDQLRQALSTHLKPFTLIFIIWMLIFYLADLYEVRTLKQSVQLAKTLIGAIILNIVISIILFYLFTGIFELTPKTNLIIFSVIFGVIDFSWRLGVIRSGYARMKVLILDDSVMVQEIFSYLKSNPQLGYDLEFWQKENLTEDNFYKLKDVVADNKIDILIIPAHFIDRNLPVVKFVYELLPFKLKIIDSVDFYESIFQKIPLEELGEGWFIEKITTRRKAYDSLKRIIDIALALIFGIILLPLIAVVAILTKLSPRKGPVIFRQQRAGINEKSFALYKFGIMRADEGPLWTLPRDERLTKLGKFLRYTHLDELPQLWNILKGDISFTGPRAERTKLVEQYKDLPHYKIRHIIKPGLTGWAQINYRPSASKDEAFEKLKYDIYYIKNRSFILDLLIILKTARSLFSNPS